MIDIDQLIGYEAERIPVKIHGREMTIRPLTAIETHQIDEALPEPRAPLVPTPGMGSNAPKVPDHEDPKYRAQIDECVARRGGARVAVALEATVGGKPFDGSREWVVAAADKIRAWIGEDLIGDLCRKFRSGESLADAVNKGKDD